MIGKTRHTPKAEVEEIFDAGAGKARGILRGPPPAGKFKHLRQEPPADLKPWIEHYWMVHWDVPEPYLQETLPHPNIYLVFEDRKCVISGVSTERFSRVLQGKSGVFGIKFRPGGFRPFLKAPVATLLNRIVRARRILGKTADILEQDWISFSPSWQADKMIATANAFFRSKVPKPDPNVDLAAGLVRKILENPTVKTVDDLGEDTGLGKRKLQRIFHEYVGINPKWVIRRYRLHELVEVLNSGGRLDWAQAALDLGYFDQAHLINDFRSLVGHSPEQYRGQR